MVIASSMRVESGPDLTAPALLAMRLLDEQTHAMMKAYERDGRITDALIGQPRPFRNAPSRSVTATDRCRPPVQPIATVR